MSKYLLTGNGDRLLTGSGEPLMADGPGPAWSEIEAAPASVKVTGSASPSALVAVTLVAGLIAMAGAATNATGIAEPSLTPATITVSGSASPFTESFAAGVITVTGTASIGADAWVIAETGQVVVTGSASPGLDTPANLSPATITVTGAATGVEYAPITIDLAPAAISFSGTASISEDTSQKWRSLWLSVYDERQKVLNAIDANNRFLAKGAGDKAQAAADAIIITNVNVGLVDDKITAESLRITDLTASVGTLDGRVTTLNQARVDDDDALAARIDSTELNLAGKASTSSLNAQISRIDTHDGKITANTNAITQVQGQIAGKADATAVSALDTFVRQDVDGRVQANSNALTQVQANLAAPFVGDFGWEFTTNQRGFSAVGASLASFPITVDDGATAIESFGNDPQFVSPVFSVSGGGHPVIRAMIRRRNAGTWDGRVFWANNNHSFSGSYVASTAPPDVGVWSVVEWDMRENTDYRTGGPINQLRFDFAASAGALVDVKWIAMGNYGQGRNAQATQILSASVDSATGIAKAIHGVTLDVNGNISGTRSENDGTRSSFNVLADKFAIVSPSGGARTEYSNGNWRVYDASGVLRVRLGVW